MNLAELLGYIQKVMPTEIEDSTYVEWVNILESNVFQEHIAGNPLRPEFNIEHEDQPTTKIVTKPTAQLDLLKYGHRWVQLYYYFLLSQTCIILEEYGKANNYIALYNEILDDFVFYYYPKMENSVRQSRMKEWR